MRTAPLTPRTPEQIPEAEVATSLDIATTLGRLEVALATLDQPFADPNWFDNALCKRYSRDAFFPPPYAGDNNPVVQTARRICSRCGVVEDCLKAALRTRDNDAVQGATSPRQRRRAIRTFVKPQQKELI